MMKKSNTSAAAIMTQMKMKEDNTMKNYASATNATRNNMKEDTMMKKMNAITTAADMSKNASACKANTSNPVLDREIDSRPCHVQPVRQMGGAPGKQYQTDFMNMIRTGVVTDVLSEKIGTSGGHLVSDEFEHKLVEALTEMNVMRQLVHVGMTESGEHRIPVVIDNGEAVWLDEGDPIPESDPTFGMIEMSAHKIATMMLVSGELLHDADFALEEYIVQEFARRLAVKEEAAIINGSGIGQPYGLLHPTFGAKEGVIVHGNTITPDDILNLVHSLPIAYRKHAVFVVSDDVVRMLRKMKTSDGHPLWSDHDLAHQKIEQMLCGYPMYICDHMPSIAPGNSPILFGDFRNYWLLDREQTSMKRLDELYAVQDMVGFKATRRTDGVLLNPDSVVRLTMGI